MTTQVCRLATLPWQSAVTAADLRFDLAVALSAAGRHCCEVCYDRVARRRRDPFCESTSIGAWMIARLFGRIQDAFLCYVQQNLADRSGICPAGLYYRVRYVGMRKAVLSRIFFRRVGHGGYHSSRNA